MKNNNPEDKLKTVDDLGKDKGDWYKYYVKKSELKALAVEWLEKDIIDYMENHLITVAEFIFRWRQRFNLKESDLE